MTMTESWRSADPTQESDAMTVVDEQETAQQTDNTPKTTAVHVLNSILEWSTEYAIVAMDLDGVIVVWNEGARRIYGYEPEEVIGKSVLILHEPDDLTSIPSLLDQARQAGKYEGRVSGIRKNGSRFTAHIMITFRYDAISHPIGFAMISRDLTRDMIEQKALEEQLRRKNKQLEGQYRQVQEANRLKSQFLASMSHELRTPLNAIIGFTEIIHSGKAGPIGPLQQEFLGDILTSSRHLLQLINDELDLAKVESGKMEFRPEPVDLRAIIREVKNGLRNFTGIKRIRIVSEIAPSLGEIVVDPAKLKQVLYNYLSNALKFTPEGGHIMVRVLPEGPDAFRMEVEDTGIGIQSSDLDRLFVEFQQLDAGTGKKHPGTGLGLILTKRIAEAQGGSVGVHSAPGKGSTFFAVLPRRTVSVPGVPRQDVSTTRLEARRPPRVEHDSPSRTALRGS
jgi:PAS domain S-box-containing protein